MPTPSRFRRSSWWRCPLRRWPSCCPGCCQRSQCARPPRPPTWGHTFAMPTARSSQQEIERALHVLSSRDSLEQLYRRLAARAGVELEARPTWLLFRLQEQAPISEVRLAQRFQVPAEQLTPSIATLQEKGLVTLIAPADGQG